MDGASLAEKRLSERQSKRLLGSQLNRRRVVAVSIILAAGGEKHNGGFRGGRRSGMWKPVGRGKICWRGRTCSEGARFAQPRASPWVAVVRENDVVGPTGQPFIGSLARWADTRTCRLPFPRVVPWAGRTAGPSAPKLPAENSCRTQPVTTSAGECAGRRPSRPKQPR